MPTSIALIPSCRVPRGSGASTCGLLTTLGNARAKRYTARASDAGEGRRLLQGTKAGTCRITKIERARRAEKATLLVCEREGAAGAVLPACLSMFVQFYTHVGRGFRLGARSAVPAAPQTPPQLSPQLLSAAAQVPEARPVSRFFDARSAQCASKCRARPCVLPPPPSASLGIAPFLAQSVKSRTHAQTSATSSYAQFSATFSYMQTQLKSHPGPKLLDATTPHPPCNSSRNGRDLALPHTAIGVYAPQAATAAIYAVMHARARAGVARANKTGCGSLGVAATHHTPTGAPTHLDTHVCARVGTAQACAHGSARKGATKGQTTCQACG